MTIPRCLVQFTKFSPWHIWQKGSKYGDNWKYKTESLDWCTETQKPQQKEPEVNEIGLFLELF